MLQVPEVVEILQIAASGEPSNGLPEALFYFLAVDYPPFLLIMRLFAANLRLFKALVLELYKCLEKRRKLGRNVGPKTT